MFQRLYKLKEFGYTPDTILDIGACTGSWTQECKNIYPFATYYLFEPIAYPQLEYFKIIPNTRVFQALLHNTEQEVDWYEMQNTGDSIYRERSHHFVNCQPMKKQTTLLHKWLDPYLSRMEHVFIKIDCQGAEIPILQGAGDILKKTDFIILEMPLFGQYNENVPNFLEHIQYMDSIGFIPFEIVDIHTIREFQMQIDMMFISKTHPFNKRVQDAIMN
jgi:FkbM family methyltransferase